MSHKPLDEKFYDQEMIRLFAPLEKEFNGQLSLYVSGSWGEKRLTTSSDQDHLIITELPLSDKEIHHITSVMREIALEIEKLGLPLCDSDMMASNPRYILSIKALTTLNPVDVIGVLKGRLLSGKELRSKEFYDFFYSVQFRKELFNLLLAKFFMFLITMNEKKRAGILKHLAIEEQYLFQSVKLKWAPRLKTNSNQYSQAFSILKNCIHHYGSFFS